MTLNEVNIDNRLRHLVRGRVLVATTSSCVEYLEEDLRTSFPLFSPGDVPAGYWFVFLVEVNGYLTFDPKSDVKISKELNPYREFYWQAPTGVNLLPADPFVPLISSVEGVYDGATNNYHQIKVSFYTGRYNSGEYRQELFDFSPAQAPNDFYNWLLQQPSAPKPGEPYKGDKSYSGFTHVG